MLKLQEANRPDSCWNKAQDDEIVFVLRSRDKAMAATIRGWAEMRVKLGLNAENDPKILEALAIAAVVDRLFYE